MNDTIIAISTPIGQSGIGIIRISGKDSFRIAQKIFRPSKNTSLNWNLSFKIYYGWIVDPGTGEKIDEVLLTLMKAPQTYTREDIVEINCHGGLVPLRKTLELGIKMGARLAQPGEFTRRAFINGRIDLIQAESVLDIVQAKTEKGLQIALNQLEGKLSEKISSLRDKMVDLLSYLEAEIEFPEENINSFSPQEKKNRIKQILSSINSLLELAQSGRIYREGIKVAIAGRINAGKSSLLNALVQRERAIVSQMPGTTRDTIEEMINLKGFPLYLIDTAGLGTSTNRVEEEGIKRAYSCIEQADIVLLMVDGSIPLTKEDEQILSNIKKPNLLLLISKRDLPLRLDLKRLRSLFPGQLCLEISALTGYNLEKLKKKIAWLILKRVIPVTSDSLTINVRQKNILGKAKIYLLRAKQALRKGLSEDFIAYDLKQAINSLGEITGESVNEEVLERIFANFCIGK